MKKMTEKNTNEFTDSMLLCFIDCESKLEFGAFSHCTCPYGKCIKKPEDIKNQSIYSYYLNTEFLYEYSKRKIEVDMLLNIIQF
jgi:hypothetical protein